MPIVNSRGLRLLAVTALLPSTVLAGCAKGSGDTESAAGGAAAGCSFPSSGSPVKPVDPPSDKNISTTGSVTATMTIDGEPVTMTLDREQTPCATHNFESLAKQGWFTDTRCHRLTDQGIFVLQCGDPSGTGSGGPGYSFADELSSAEALAEVGQGSDGNKLVNYAKGTVAMANAGPNTNGSQIFLVYQDSTLPPAYTVFGTMDEKSVDVIGKIAAQGVAADNTAPNAPAKITDVTLG
ncbi:peptidylprolyl isomerase [Luteococcus sp. Sow4_B9]|uniref:peptidylprolyl isomerase n=1 Tax=Luteococcus sp. Sow4_B9 TaxID=3438792 RepID=UPI003F9BC544